MHEKNENLISHYTLKLFLRKDAKVYKTRKSKPETFRSWLHCVFSGCSAANFPFAALAVDLWGFVLLFFWWKRISDMSVSAIKPPAVGHVCFMEGLDTPNFPLENNLYVKIENRKGDVVSSLPP